MFKEDVLIEDAQTVSTDYETERNKPMPNRIHGNIQAEIIFLLKLDYRDKYDFSSEVTLDTQPKATTPDICVYPKKILHLKDMTAKEPEMPIAAIEIQSPSQSPEVLIKKAWDYYFPAGIKSFWMVIPSLKTVRIVLPDNQNLIFTENDELHDPVADIRISVKKIFEGIEL